MTLEVIKARSELVKTKAAIAAGKLTVGFLGGSITDARVGFNWPEPVVAHLVHKYPGVRITVENAAIGATGSDSAVFRADRDIIGRHCDLVFVEYAVNDSGTDPIIRGRSREGLIRKLRSAGMDVVVVYTFSADMHEAMAAGQVPATIAEFELIAEHYHVSSVWMGLHALNQVDAGLLRWYEWLPDNLHPQYRGSQVYADSVNAYLDDALASSAATAPGSRELSMPLDPHNWESATRISYDAVVTTGPWTIRRWPTYEWIDQTLETSAPGAALSLNFTGRVLWLGVEFGKRTADFRYRIDGGDWVDHPLDRPYWVGDNGWFRGVLLAHDLTPAEHKLELVTKYNAGENALGTDFKIGLIGHVPE